MARQNDGEYHLEINKEGIITPCHSSSDKIPTLRSHDTANAPPSKEMTGINGSNQPQQSAPTRSTPYSNGAKCRGSKPLPGAAECRADSRLPHFLSVLPPRLDPWHFSPTLATDREGGNETGFLYFVRGVPETHIPVPITITSNSEGRLSAILTGNVSCDYRWWK